MIWQEVALVLPIDAIAIRSHDCYISRDISWNS